MTFAKLLSTALLFFAITANANSQLELGRQAIKNLAGCFLVDYSYTETESLKEGYIRDPRVYDVNKDKSIKEWIFTEEVSPTRIRVQHVMFGTELSGQFMEGSELRHTGEDWEFDGQFLYDFTGPLNWAVKKIDQGQWTRKITNLDDGLRYQCASKWTEDTAYPEWSCSGYAPIPGRETRDMGRKDYQTLDRSTRLVVYSNNWLERQANVKTIHDEAGVRTPLAKELGKNWYVRLPDSECNPIQPFIQKYGSFWSVLREAWDLVLIGDRSFVEMKVGPTTPTRYTKMLQLEEKYHTQNLSDPTIRKAAKDEITKVIESYRVN